MIAGMFCGNVTFNISTVLTLSSGVVLGMAFRLKLLKTSTMFPCRVWKCW